LRSSIDEVRQVAARSRPDTDELVAEAWRLAREVVATRRQMRAGVRPDPATMARLSKCYDRLDDIAEAIGLSRVQQIYTTAAEDAPC